MIDALKFTYESLCEYGIGVSLSLSFTIILLAVIIGIRGYGKNYLKRLLSKRNLCWVITWLVAAALLLTFQGYGIWSSIPLWLMIAIALVYLLFTYAVFASVSATVLFSKLYFSFYKKQSRLGRSYEHRKFTSKRPWFLLDANERIEYEILKSSYQQDLGDIKGAYDSLCNARRMQLYPEEKVNCDISRAYLLVEMGDLTAARIIADQIKDMDKPAFCFLSSYILENEGKLDESFRLAKIAESSMDPNYRETRVKQCIYNHLGRLYCFKGNQTEVYRYYNLAICEAKKMRDYSQINNSYLNLINQYINNDFSEYEVRTIAKDYFEQIDTNTVDGICKRINLTAQIERHFNHKDGEEATIRQGYEELKKHSGYPALAVNRVQLLHMLYVGGFELEPLLSDVKNDMELYREFEMPQRADVYIALGYFVQLPHKDFHRLVPIRNEVERYLSEFAISDLRTYYNTLQTNCVYQRCHILESMIDVCALLRTRGNDQLQWIEDVIQIYKDNGLILRQAQKYVDKVKCYAQQYEGRCDPPEEIKYELDELLEKALVLSERVPWPYLGNLLTDIACAYSYLKDTEKVIHTVKRFDDLGLKEEYSEYHRYQAMNCLRNEYNLNR